MAGSCAIVLPVLFFARPDIIIYRNAKEINIVTVSKTQYRV